MKVGDNTKRRKEEEEEEEKQQQLWPPEEYVLGCNPSTWRQGDQEFKAILCHIISLRPAWIT